ncbi:MAG: rod shape-determining protein MreD [Elusimicrobia bacterium]|nr:rod shape-determining protein MreD [Elusimicrobiota bacterium]
MRVLAALGLFLAGLAVQWVFSTHLSFWGVSPYVLMSLTLAAAATAGPVAAECLGFAWGLSLDAMSGHVFGANALCFTLLAYAVSTLRRQMDVASPVSQAIIAAACVPLCALFYGLVGSVFEHSFLWPGWGPFLLDPAYTALVTPAAFAACRRWLRP